MWWKVEGSPPNSSDLYIWVPKIPDYLAQTLWCYFFLTMQHSRFHTSLCFLSPLVLHSGWQVAGEPVPAILGPGSGCTLHKLQVHRRTNTHSLTLNLRCMSLDWTKKTLGDCANTTQRGVSWNQTCTFTLPRWGSLHSKLPERSRPYRYTAWSETLIHFSLKSALHRNDHDCKHTHARVRLSQITCAGQTEADRVAF